MKALVAQRLWRWNLVAGLLTTIIGVVVLAWPGPPILIASTLFGVYLLISGLAELTVAFTMHRSAATRVMFFISGATSLVLAILALRLYGNGYAVPLLALWLGIGFLLQGSAGVAAGIGARNLPDRGWYIVAGIVSVIAGIVVLVWPFDSITALTLAAGIWLLVIGISQLVLAFQTRKAASTAHRFLDGSAEHPAVQ
jgi:uncharacterized membrane protein HdeD (DUF308 family)